MWEIDTFDSEIEQEHGTKMGVLMDSLLTSPIPGPPKTRISSLEDPPLSLIGIILEYNISTGFKSFRRYYEQVKFSEE